MSDVNQITPEELVQLRTLQESYSEITAKFGQLKVEQILLKGQLERLAELEKSFELQYTETQTKETEFLQSLETKYGRISINIETGEISK
jgi:hypothetical protein